MEQRGIEPLTSALRTRRSAKLSYCPTPEENTVSSFEFQVSSFTFRTSSGIRDMRSQAFFEVAYSYKKAFAA